MKKLFESWRHYKLLIEQEDEWEEDREEEGPDSDLRKQVYPQDIKTIPIQRWADEHGFTLRQLDPKRLKSYLGKGAFGKAFVAVKDGKEYAVKIGDAGREDEMKVIDKLLKTREGLPDDIKRHVIKFYSPEELGFKDTVKDDRGVLYHVSVAELLQPLTAGDLKKLDPTRFQGFDNIEVAKNPFWNNEEWGEVEQILNDRLPNLNKIKRLFIDAMYEVRSLIGKSEKLNLLLYAKDPGVRAQNSRDEQMLKNFGRPALMWDNIWTDMIMSRLFKEEKGKRLLNHYTKNMGMEPQEALANIWSMVDKAGKLIFFANQPTFYDFEDKDTEPDNLPAGELKSFNRAMKALRDEYGILANDLHRGNIMRRGDDWVVMDVGLFEIDADF